MIIDNVGECMIRFRLKQKTYSKVDDVVLRDKAIAKVVNLLDRDRVSNYGLSVNIPDDVISISYGVGKKCVVNIPLELNQFQYDIEDYFLDQRPRLRYNSFNSRNILKYAVKDYMDEIAIYKLALYIIDRVGYLVLCPEQKYI